jgi:hypothetical protein
MHDRGAGTNSKRKIKEKNNKLCDIELCMRAGGAAGDEFVGNVFHKAAPSRA